MANPLVVFILLGAPDVPREVKLAFARLIVESDGEVVCGELPFMERSASRKPNLPNPLKEICFAAFSKALASRAPKVACSLPEDTDCNPYLEAALAKGYQCEVIRIGVKPESATPR